MLLLTSNLLFVLVIIADNGSSTCLLSFKDDTTGVTYLHVWNNDVTLRTNVERINCLVSVYPFLNANDVHTLHFKGVFKMHLLFLCFRLVVCFTLCSAKIFFSKRKKSKTQSPYQTERQI